MFRLTWDDYIQRIKRLGDILEENINVDDYIGIYGIPRGGSIPATILSHRLGLDVISDIWNTLICNLIFPKDKKILIVDDIIDTGTTISRYMQTVPSIHYTTCSLLVRHSSNYIPDYTDVVVNSDDWIIFPYEKTPQNETTEIEDHKIKCQQSE